MFHEAVSPSPARKPARYSGSERRSAPREISNDAAADAMLLHWFQHRGDKGALKALFNRHRPALLAFARRLCGDRTIAEDITQHAWLALLEAIRDGGYRPRSEARFRTYLFTVARNWFVDEYRRKHAATRTIYSDALIPEPDSAAAHAATPEQLADRALHRRLLRQAIRQLPSAQSEVIKLWASGCDIDTMAAMTGASRDTVLSRRKYALAKLREQMRHFGLQPDFD